ncbi:MAG: polysaccharide deacetylase family protein [bacterium]
MDNSFSNNFTINNNCKCSYCWIPIEKESAVKIKGEFYCSPGCYKQKQKYILKLKYQHLWKDLKQKINHPSSNFMLPMLAILIVFLIVFMKKAPSFYPKDQLVPDTKPHNEKNSTQQNSYINVPLASITNFSARPALRHIEDEQISAPDEKNPGNPLQYEADLIDLDTSLHDEAMVDTIKIMLIDEYPKSILKTVAVAGQAPVNSVIALYHNEKLQKATTCIDGNFFFPRINLFPNQNIIEVEAFNEHGGIIPSNSIEVFIDPNLDIHERGMNIIRGNLNKKNFALTFDGGGGADLTNEILDTLARYNIKSTFFLTGTFISNYPEAVKRIVAGGHEVGNHSDTHPHLTKFNSKKRFVTLPWVTKEYLQDELKSVAEKFYALTGHQIAPFWRAPYGGHNLEIRKWAEELGYTHISWTCGRVLAESLDTLDWVYDPNSDIYFSAKDIRDKLVSFGENLPHGANGGISLMHLSTGRPKNDRIHKQLPSIIEGLRNRGYTFKTIGELLENQLSFALKTR